jgi:hypothetical protein
MRATVACNLTVARRTRHDDSWRIRLVMTILDESSHFVSVAPRRLFKSTSLLSFPSKATQVPLCVRWPITAVGCKLKPRCMWLVFSIRAIAATLRRVKRSSRRRSGVKIKLPHVARRSNVQRRAAMRGRIQSAARRDLYRESAPIALRRGVEAFIQEVDFQPSNSTPTTRNSTQICDGWVQCIIMHSPTQSIIWRLSTTQDYGYFDMHGLECSIIRRYLFGGWLSTFEHCIPK